MSTAAPPVVPQPMGGDDAPPTNNNSHRLMVNDAKEGNSPSSSLVGGGGGGTLLDDGANNNQAVTAIAGLMSSSGSGVGGGIPSGAGGSFGAGGIHMGSYSPGGGEGQLQQGISTHRRTSSSQNFGGGGSSTTMYVSGRVTETTDGDAQPQYHRKRDHTDDLQEHDLLVSENQRLQQENLRLAHCVSNLEEMYQRKCSQVAALEMQLACPDFPPGSRGSENSTTATMPYRSAGLNVAGGGGHPGPMTMMSASASVVTDEGSSFLGGGGGSCCDPQQLQQQGKPMAYRRHRKKSRSNTPNVQQQFGTKNSNSASPTTTNVGSIHQCTRNANGQLCCPPGYRMTGEGSSCQPPPLTEEKGVGGVGGDDEGLPLAAGARPGVYGQVSDHSPLQGGSGDLQQQQQLQGGGQGGRQQQQQPNTNSIECEICGIFVNSELVMQSHLVGEKHRRAVNRRNAQFQMAEYPPPQVSKKQQQQQQQSFGQAPIYQQAAGSNSGEYEYAGASYHQHNPYGNISGSSNNHVVSNNNNHHPGGEHSQMMDVPPPPPPPPRHHPQQQPTNGYWGM